MHICVIRAKLAIIILYMRYVSSVRAGLTPEHGRSRAVEAVAAAMTEAATAVDRRRAEDGGDDEYRGNITSVHAACDGHRRCDAAAETTDDGGRNTAPPRARPANQCSFLWLLRTRAAREEWITVRWNARRPRQRNDDDGPRTTATMTTTTMRIKRKRRRRRRRRRRRIWRENTSPGPRLPGVASTHTRGSGIDDRDGDDDYTRNTQCISRHRRRKHVIM